MASQIATKYGHLVFFTPPYHPTLEPIELMWGMVKGDIARSPAKNATEMIDKIIAGLSTRNDNWLRLFRHTQEQEHKYLIATVEREL
ncbi:hypothetical protein P43SY_002927 [Pythium insidiosum]|uniref:Tc1-like transposase DDE domain-containing protein n=1 Tax=Pythium insidiosum TaxID=114742 RepID=A0AAD5LWT9_PYTIN|nr:hypothetical protein P43SY_002927 [Pythium insidiosum]